MGTKARVVFAAASIICWILALQLAGGAGLPNRTASTGLMIGGEMFAPEVGALAPPFAAPSLDGDTFSLLDRRGEVVLVNFWATWCEPCRYELLELSTLVQNRDSITLVAINSGDSPQAITAWLQTHSIENQRDAVVTIPDEGDTIARRYAIRGRPTTLIIDPNGRIVHIASGVIARSDVEAVLSQLASSS